MTGRPFARWRSRWESFWFQEVPPELYGLLRIAFGALGVIGLLGATPVSMFWSLDGIAPVPGGGLGLRSLAASLGVGSIAGAVLFAALVASFVAMAVGWYSRWAVAACFLGSLLQSRWNNLPQSSAHDVLVAVLFCLLWVDTGAALSVSATRATSSRVEWQPIWPLQLLRCQIAIIYFSSGFWKVLEPMWREGVAVYYAASNNIFHRFPFAIPASADWLLVTATYVTLVWELAFGPMLLHRVTRRLALALGVLLHTGMWLFLELGPFSAVMIASYIAFCDPVRVSRAIKQRSTRGIVPSLVRVAAVRRSRTATAEHTAGPEHPRFGSRRGHPTAAAD